MSVEHKKQGKRRDRRDLQGLGQGGKLKKNLAQPPMLIMSLSGSFKQGIVIGSYLYPVCSRS